MIKILFAAVTERWDQYQGPLKKELDLLGLEYKLAILFLFKLKLSLVYSFQGISNNIST